MLMLGGAIQFGMIFWGQNTLNQIVRDAGRYAVTMPNCLPASKTAVEGAITNPANGFARSFAGTITGVNVTLGTTTPVSDPCPATSNAQHVWAHIKVDGTVPIFFPLIPGNGAISSEATFRMEPVNP